MDNNRTTQEPNQEQPRRRRSRRRRRPVILSILIAMVYVVVVIFASVSLAKFGWSVANDVLALNKESLTAELTLDADMFDVVSYEAEVEKDGVTTTETKTYKVLKDGELDNVVDMLYDAGLIQYKWVFKMFTSITNSEGKFQPGVYNLDSDMDYRALITHMGTASASRKTVTLTFPEGCTIDQIFEKMEENGVATVEELQDMAANHNYAFDFLQTIPLGDYHRLEGYMFPDTYEFYIADDPKYVINKLLVNFDAKYDEDMRELVTQSGRSLYEILTIASMIEKETDGHDETKISSVIYNRLNNNGQTAGFLQIDATIFYVTGETVTKDDYQNVDSPYNTYKYKGLPPGPIANPGLSAIKAALDPDSTYYYFYVLNPNTNRHEFTTNYDAHRLLVNKYYG